MKNKGTKKHLVRWILLALLVVALICGGFYSYFGGFNKVTS